MEITLEIWNLPSKGYERIYRVCIRGQIEKKDMKILTKE